jgi:hypothetical protein
MSSSFVCYLSYSSFRFRASGSATGEEAEEPDTQPYLINEALHDMIRETAEQDPGVVLLEKSTTEEEEA